ncbi:hypothetical protein, partial [Candidatus Competibacter phosphatis]|uniref:hypothetical protein n=1 Tax=Candidatus Competibacter phosphatis TaxID=221280 RepID=UPI00145F1AAF
NFPCCIATATLLDNHPTRVIVPVAPGFGKAVKVAVSLDFAVRLEVEQPEPALIEEMAAVLEFYLHQSTVAQPIEYFHGSLQGFSMMSQCRYGCCRTTIRSICATSPTKVSNDRPGGWWI